MLCNMNSTLTVKWLQLLVTWLQLSLISCRKHETLVLQGSRHKTSDSRHIAAVDGITVMAESLYRDTHLYQTAIIMPFDTKARLLIKFDYLDIDKSKPCTDFLTMCELNDLSSLVLTTMCQRQMIYRFCGNMNDLFPVTKFDMSEYFMVTSQPGHGVWITWTTGNPRGDSRGFKLTITAFTAPDVCDKDTHWVCVQDQRCISTDLLCDGVAHCCDGSDEQVNCTHAMPVNEPPLCLPASCQDSGLRWNLHHNTLTLIIPMGLAIVLLLVALLWKYKRMFHHLVSGRPPPQSPTVFESSEIATAEQECMVHPFELGHGVGGEHAHPLDPSLGVLLPPPYSPREEDTCSLAPPTEGDPPPLYEDAINEDANNFESSVLGLKATTSSVVTVDPDAPPGP